MNVTLFCTNPIHHDDPRTHSFVPEAGTRHRFAASTTEETITSGCGPVLMTETRLSPVRDYFCNAEEELDDPISLSRSTSDDKFMNTNNNNASSETDLNLCELDGVDNADSSSGSDTINVEPINEMDAQFNQDQSLEDVSDDEMFFDNFEASGGFDISDEISDSSSFASSPILRNRSTMLRDMVTKTRAFSPGSYSSLDSVARDSGYFGTEAWGSIRESLADEGSLPSLGLTDEPLDSIGSEDNIPQFGWENYCLDDISEYSVGIDDQTTGGLFMFDGDDIIPDSFDDVFHEKNITEIDCTDTCDIKSSPSALAEDANPSASGEIYDIFGEVGLRERKASSKTNLDEAKSVSDTDSPIQAKSSRCDPWLLGCTIGALATVVIAMYLYVDDQPRDHAHFPPLTWWRHQMETFSALLALCEGNPPVTGGFPSQKPVTRSFDVFLICTWTNG